MKKSPEPKQKLGGPNEVYETPEWCVDRLLDEFKGFCFRGNDELLSVVEPAVGDGAIIRAVSKRIGHDYPEAKLWWTAFDIRSDIDFTNLGPAEGRYTKGCDFLERQKHDCDDLVDIVITNPPYSLAGQFIDKSRELYPSARIIMLLRLGFLASEDRAEKWKEWGEPDLYILPNRPCFRRGRSDNSDYAWFVFQPQQFGIMGRFQKVCHLALTTLSVRRPK